MINKSIGANSVLDESKNNEFPSSTEMFIDYAEKTFKEVLKLANASAKENVLKEIEEEGFLNSNDFLNKSAGISIPYPTVVKDFIISTVTENLSKVIQSPSEETSTLSDFEFSTMFYGNNSQFGNETGEKNGTFFGNFTSINSTATGYDADTTGLRNMIFLGAVVFICVVVLFGHWVCKAYSRRRSEEEEAYYPSQVMVNYKARYPEDVTEETEFCERTEHRDQDSETEAGPSTLCGEIRTTQALVRCSSPKSKSKHEYTPVPTVEDFEGKIASQADIDQEVTDVCMKDCETQTPSDDAYENITNEQLEKLREECEAFDFMDD